MPVRHWLLLLHRIDIAQADLPDKDEPKHPGIDPASVLSAGGRIQEAMSAERLPTVAELQPALERRNRELIQEAAVRSIIEYAKLTVVRDRLHLASAEATRSLTFRRA